MKNLLLWGSFIKEVCPALRHEHNPSYFLANVSSQAKISQYPTVVNSDLAFPKHIHLSRTHSAISRARKGKQMPGTCKAGRSGAWLTGSNRALMAGDSDQKQLPAGRASASSVTQVSGAGPGTSTQSTLSTANRDTGTLWPSKGWAFLLVFRLSLLLLGQQYCSEPLVVGTMSRGLCGYKAI